MCGTAREIGDAESIMIASVAGQAVIAIVAASVTIAVGHISTRDIFIL